MSLLLGEPHPQNTSSLGALLLLSLHADPTTRVGAPENGGVTIYVRELARAFAEAGWAVDLVTRRQSPDAPEREIMDGINIIRVEAGPAHACTNDEMAQYLPQAVETVRAIARARSYRFISSHFPLATARAWH